MRGPIEDYYRMIAVCCLLVGSISSALFFAVQAISTKYNANVRREVTLALIASISLALGLVSILLSVGVWI